MRARSLLAHLMIVVTVVGAPLARLPAAAQEQKEQPAPQVAPPISIPEEEKARKNPLKPTPESIDAGRRLFSTQCKMCHGEKGDGKGDLAVELKLAIPDFIDPKQQKSRTDGELFYLLTQGHGRMPGQGERLRPEQKWNLINFIRSLASPEKPTAEEKK